MIYLLLIFSPSDANPAKKCGEMYAEGEGEEDKLLNDAPKFNPDMCSDVNELRNRLYEAYDKINHLSNLNNGLSKVKQENNYLRNELTKCDHRWVSVWTHFVENLFSQKYCGTDFFLNWLLWSGQKSEFCKQLQNLLSRQ